MKKKYFTACILFCLMPLLSNCASQQDVQNLNYHIRTINKKLEDMKVNTVDRMQQRQASSSGQLDQLQSDLLQLKSKLEENAHVNLLLQEQNKELQQTIQSMSLQQEEVVKTKLAELNSKLESQKESLTLMQQARIKEAERRSREAQKAADAAMRKARQARISKAVDKTSSKEIVHLTPNSKKVLFTNISRKDVTTTPTKATTTTFTTTSTKVTEKKPIVKQETDTLAKAQQAYRDGKYKEAYKLFERNLSKKSSTKSALTARYMMGECLFKEGEFDQAIIQYQQIITNFPGNPQSAKALLRQGEAFEQLSDTETARIIYRKITASYGSSPEAATAKKKIDAL